MARNKIALVGAGIFARQAWNFSMYVSHAATPMVPAGGSSFLEQPARTISEAERPARIALIAR